MNNNNPKTKNGQQFYYRDIKSRTGTMADSRSKYYISTVILTKVNLNP